MKKKLLWLAILGGIAFLAWKKKDMLKELYDEKIKPMFGSKDVEPVVLVDAEDDLETTDIINDASVTSREDSSIA